MVIFENMWNNRYIASISRINHLTQKSVCNLVQSVVHVTTLLQEMNIICDALVNDTVGTLLSGALEDSACAIGLILCKICVFRCFCFVIVRYPYT